MKKYIAHLLLSCILTPSNLYASPQNVSVSDEMSATNNPQMLKELSQHFHYVTLNHPGYEHLDENRSIRNKLNEFSASPMNAGGYQEDFRIDAHFKKFLEFSGLSADGSYDLNDMAMKHIYIVHGFYIMDHIIHQALIKGATMQYNRIVDEALTHVSEQILSEPAECRFMDSEGIVLRVNTVINKYPALSADTREFLDAFKEAARRCRSTMVQLYLNEPNLSRQEFLSFMAVHQADALLNLTTAREKVYEDSPIIYKTVELYRKFLTTASTIEELSELKHSLATIAIDFSELAEHLMELWKVQHNEIIEITLQLGLNYWIEWVVHTQRDIFPITVVDRLFIRGFSSEYKDVKFSDDQLNIENFPTLVNELSLYLDGLHTMDANLQLMLRFIEMRSGLMHRGYNKKFHKPLIFNGKILPHMNMTIRNFFKRIESEKQAAIAAEKQALKAKSQRAANDLYFQRYSALTDDANKKMQQFMSSYPSIKNEAFKNSLSHNEHYMVLQKLMVKIAEGLQVLIRNQTIGTDIDIHMVMAMTETNKSLNATLIALGKDIDHMPRENKNAQKTLVKAQKKRLKAEAKAQEKAERAKQKAEEKAKRESIKRLSLKMATPSPDPSPYPSGAEKRLSVKAEIAEKHKSATLRLLEKEQRKSLRQSVKDLLHIGEADIQKDKRDSKRFSQRSSKRKSEVLDEKPEAPLDLSQFGAVDRASIDKETLEIWEGKRVVTHQDSVVAILDQLNGATSLQEISNSFSHGDNFEPLNASSKLKDFKFSKKGQVYSIRVHGKADKHRICFIWDDKEKKARKVQYGTYH